MRVNTRKANLLSNNLIRRLFAAGKAVQKIEPDKTSLVMQEMINKTPKFTIDKYKEHILAAQKNLNSDQTK